MDKDCEQIDGFDLNLYKELLIVTVLDPPAVSYELIPTSLSCKGLELTVSLVDSSDLANTYFENSTL
jgi:hypothetical protein